MYASEHRRSNRFSDDPFLCSHSRLADSGRVLRRRFAISIAPVLGDVLFEIGLGFYGTVPSGLGCIA
jgi:hypothetical protein